MILKPYFFFPVLISLLGLTACSDDKSSDPQEDSSSSSSSLESSSSSYSNRLDVDYLDTLISGDTANFYLSDSIESPLRLFLGELPSGTRITIRSATTAIKNDTLRVREEIAGALIPTEPVIENETEIYKNYTYPGEGANLLSNTFITTEKSGYYFVELRGAFGTDSHLRISIETQKAYYRYIGDTTTVPFTMGDTIQGFFLIGTGADSLNLNLKTPTGYSINVNAKNTSFKTSGATKISLLKAITLTDEKGKTIASNADSIDQQLLPQDSTTWRVTLKPLSFATYISGPYAFFKASATARELDKGEYFASPDSIQKVGDTLTIVRPRNDAAKYYLRQDQYVWLADLKKGDSLYVFHEIEGYYTGPSYPATYAILNKSGDSIAAITTANYVYVAKSDGPYYLHYTRLNSPPKTETQELTLKTFIQRPSFVTDLYFYDEDKAERYSTMSLTQGDSLVLSDLVMGVTPATASNAVYWYIPCEDLAYIGSVAYSTSTCSGTEQLISANKIYGLGIGGDTGRLIALSKADPQKRDTLTITILE